jgi:hypothetical protein
MPDDFAGHEAGLSTPARDAGAILPSDAAALPRATRALWCGTAGDVRVRMVSGAVVTFAGLPAGTLLPLRVDQVFATGTTAGALVGLR